MSWLQKGIIKINQLFLSIDSDLLIHVQGVLATVSDFYYSHYNYAVSIRALLILHTAFPILHLQNMFRVNDWRNANFAPKSNGNRRIGITKNWANYNNLKLGNKRL